MILNSRSRLTRWAYYFLDDRPASTTLCRFFWLAFVSVPLVWLCIITVVGSLIYIMGVSLSKNPWAIVAALSLVLSAVAVFFGLVYLISHRHRLIPKRVRESVFAQGLVALKGRLCPIVYFE